MPAARSKASTSAGPPLQQTTPTQEESVAVNWLFFDKSHPENSFPLSIEVPRSLFAGKSQECRGLFAAKLLQEFTFDTHESNIKFWKPKELLPVDNAYEPGWTGDIDEVSGFSKRIPYTRPFATALEREIANEDAVHLVVTAPGSYQAATPGNYGQPAPQTQTPPAAVTIEDLERLRTYLWGKNRVDVVSVAGKSYSTVDLTLFRLKLNTRPDNILLVRNEYVIAYNAILADTRRQSTIWWRSATLVTGHPGIGKTHFLLYILARRLQEQEPVALQINSNEYALFDKHGVSLHSSESGRVPTGAWALSDSSGEHRGLCTAFENPFAHVIHTSSPASRRWKDWVKRLSADRYIMDVWSLEELRTLLTIQNLNVQRGEALFRKFGPSPRIIIDIVLKPTKEAEYLSDVRAGAVKLASQFSTAFLELQSLDFSSEISSKIFTVRPDISNARQPALYIPTRFLSSSLGIAMSQQVGALQHTFFNMLSGHPSLRSTAGWLFENYAHVYFSNPNHDQIQVYTRNDPTPHLIPTPAKMITGSMLTTIQPPHDFYWRPRESNFEGVDAVIRAGNIVWALQFTISASHRSAAGGLSKVFDDMNHKTGVEWRLVMVGPERRDAELARDRQRLGGRWVGTPVYACELPLGKFTEDDEQQLQDILNEANDTYPVDQGADSDVSTN